MATRVIYRENGEAWFTVEIGDPSPEVAHPSSPLRGRHMNAAMTSLGEAGEVIAKTANDIFGAMKDALSNASPDDVELTFGVKLGMEGSLPMVTKASGEATFEVKLHWNNAGNGTGSTSETA